MTERLSAPKEYGEIKSPGEKELLPVFEELTNQEGWYVLHSVRIAKHSTKSMGEIDFVVIIPGTVVVCIEVKAANTLKVDKGVWYWGCMDAKEESPFSQVADAMFSLLKWIKNNIDRNALGFPFIPLVITTHLDLTSPQLAVEADNQCEYISASKIREKLGTPININLLKTAILESVASTLSKIKIKYNRKAEDYDVIAKSMFQKIRPSFHAKSSIDSTVINGRADVVKATEEQLNAFTLATIIPMFFVAGLAGTGKTIIATALARQKAKRSDKVVLICFNRHMMQYFKENLKALNIAVYTIDQLFMKITNVSIDGTNDVFWSSELPEMVLERLTNSNFSFPAELQYDHLFIDEAQDIFRNDIRGEVATLLFESMLSVTFQDMKNEADSQNKSIFACGDPQNQDIYANHIGWTFEDFKVHGFFCRELLINCRNTEDIGIQAQAWGRLNPPYEGFRIQRRAGSYVRKNISDEKEKLKILKNQVTSALNNGYSDIVILTPSKGNANSYTQIKGYGDLTSAKKVRCGTIHCFKGLDADVVILVDINDKTDKKLIHLGISRAKQKLILITSRELMP